MSEMKVENGDPATGIGGDVQLVSLTTKGVTVRKAHRFSDYTAVAAEIRERRRDR